ncbi:MAG: hypothetical protein H8E44_45630 [Planctomycetes bacterium]|nr:hypothetical protein [Planctomycetota bacterium]
MAALLTVSAGCAMCGSPHDCTYSAYGGRWQRADPSNGRVGSVLDAADVQIAETEMIYEGELEAVASEGDPGDDEASEQDSVLTP